MKIYRLIILAAVLVVTGNALADNGEALAKKHNCTMCHAVASKSLGPSFMDIAEKYKAGKDAQAQLELKVRSGGAGVWGKRPMPNTDKSVSDDDIRAIVKWTLSLK